MRLLYPLLSKLVQGSHLAEPQAEKLFYELFQKRLSKGEAKALLLLLARKGEHVSEISGCLNAIRRFEPPMKIRELSLMDTCGTGGDQKSTFNISTLAAIVIAGAGGKVAKHGNRSISSLCGSSDLMEALGVQLDAPVKNMVESIRRFGIGYFHAPFYHPIFSQMQPLRRELKVRTIFNMLGPLVNPLDIHYQLMGVAQNNLLEIYGKVMVSRIKKAWICHSLDHLDEISTVTHTKVIDIEKGHTRHFYIKPQLLGIRKSTLDQLKGGTPQKNRVMALKLLKGELKKDPLYDIVMLNAAAGLLVCGKAKTWSSSMALARESIDSGKALQSLRGLIKLSRKGSI